MVVLGLNFADDREIALQFIEENGVTYTNILDASEESWDVMMKYETLGMTAVPMTYVVDPEGKIMESWYGFDEGQMQKTLEKMKPQTIE